VFSKEQTVYNRRGHTGNQWKSWAQHLLFNSAPVRGNRLTNFYIDRNVIFEKRIYETYDQEIFNMIAVQIEDWRHPPPPYTYLTHFFRVIVPLSQI
jgi:hypothetical protein